ncbi:MAG: TIGR03000 domain-containing protein [Planctomycetia bacterium]
MVPQHPLRLASVSAALVVALIVALVGPEARAGWHHHVRQGCSACGGSGGSGGGSHGQHRCWRCRHHASHGSSGGSSGGSTGGSSGGDAAKAADAPKDTAKDAKKTAAVGVPADGVMLVVEVPEDATLLVNGRETNLSGTVRNFVSAGLSDDEQYDYTISMRVTRGGKVEEQTRTVSVSGGQRHVVAFAAPQAPATPLPATVAVTTSLTLRVPEGAKVWIEGQPTAKEGAVREFLTSALHAGETWEGYEVKVAMVVDGRSIETTKRIDLIGGKAIDLAIDPAAALAAESDAGEPSPTVAADSLGSTASLR